LKRIFVLNPNHRITAKQALQHPFLVEEGQPDDGPVAAEIH
jgi:dual-specificity kinase